MLPSPCQILFSVIYFSCCAGFFSSPSFNRNLISHDPSLCSTRRFSLFKNLVSNREPSSRCLSKPLRNAALNELPPNDESDTRNLSENVSNDLSSYDGSHEATVDNAISLTDLEHVGTAGTFRERFGKVIPEWLSERLEQGGFSVPTSVQAEAIETVVVQGRDALVQAYTGT
jgi:hypothetical protein